MSRRPIARSSRLVGAVSDPAPRNRAEYDWSTWRSPPVDADIALLSPAHLWLRRLPRSVHPIQLCRYHPRLANLLAQCWPDVRRTDRVLRELMVDRRGNRQGFGPRIAGEIARLHRFHALRLARELPAIHVELPSTMPGPL